MRPHSIPLVPASVVFFLFLCGLISSGPALANEATFCISGSSDGVPWSWAIVGSENACKELNVGPLPAGAGPTAFRDAFIASINNNPECFNIFHAIPHPDPACFTILKGQALQFYVGPAGTDPSGPGGCLVTPAGCAFNPIIAEIAPIATEESGWGRIKTRYRD
jgi:hypothetical protein